MPLNNSTFQFLVPAGPPEITILAKLLNRLLTRIQQNLTAHQDFVAQAAHQLKTPLTIAKGHLEQLEQTVAPNLSGNLKVAVDEIDIMSGIISNLLTLVQIESGFQTFKSIEVDLLDQVMSEIDRLDYLARKKSLKFQIKCDDNDAPLTGWTTTTDPQLLSIILHNIFENALKYASESPIEVNLIVNKTNLIVQICNQTEQIFTTFSSINLKEKFVRGDTPEPGQGLGLYIAYKIASILNINLGIQQENNLFIVSLKIPNTLNRNF